MSIYGKLSNSNTPSIPIEALFVPNNTWLENTITYNNKPAPTGSALATVNAAGTANQYYEWDITAQVNSLRASGVNLISVMIRNTIQTSSTRFVANSKQSSTNKPQLIYTN